MFVLCLSFLVSSVYSYVIHVDCDIPSINEVSEYGVHHGLEGGGRVGQAEEHNCGFEESFVCDEGCLPSVFFLDEDFIISPFNIHPCE